MALCTSCTTQSIPYLPLKTATISPVPLIEQDESAEGADGPAINGSYTDELDLSDPSETAKDTADGSFDYVGAEAEGGNGGAGKLDLYV